MPSLFPNVRDRSTDEQQFQALSRAPIVSPSRTMIGAGNALGHALRRAGGIEDKPTKINRIKEQMNQSGMKFGTGEYMTTLADMLAQEGLIDEAVQVAQHIPKMEQKKPIKVARVIKADSEEGKSIGLTEDSEVKGFMGANGQFETVTEINGLGGDSITVNTGNDESEFQKKRAGEVSNQISLMQESGTTAQRQSRSLRALTELLMSGDVKTGTLQPAITSLQGLAGDLGIDAEKIAGSMGIDIGNLSSKQEFDRLTKELVIDGFEKFKGNLNQKEVEMALDAFNSLGKNEEANIKAIAFLRASAEISKVRGAQAAMVKTEEDAKKLIADMIGEDGESFRALQKQYESEMLAALKESPKPSDSGLTDEEEAELRELEKEFGDAG